MDYSVIIRTKNSERTIKECIRSVLRQTLQPIEILIIDSGSSDRTLEIVRGFLKVQIIKYIPSKRFNYSEALNLGIIKASGSNILLLSSHVKILNVNTVEWMCQLLNKDENCIAVSIRSTLYKNYSNLQEGNEEIKSRDINLENFQGFAMYNSCSFLKKEVWEKRNFNESIPRCEDQEWAFFYLNQRKFTTVIDEPKVFYNNPYRNFKKDLWDYITIGELVFPYFISDNFIKQNLKEGFFQLKKRNYKSFKFHLKLAFFIFIHTKIYAYEIQSISNKELI